MLLNKIVQIKQEGRYEGRVGYAARFHQEWGYLVHIRSLLHSDEFEMSAWLSPKVLVVINEEEIV